MMSKEIPEHPIPAWFATTTMIQDRSGGHATGFFFEQDGNSYLITNRHVVDRTSINGESLKQVRIFTRPKNDNTSLEFHELRLYIDNEPTWLSHPRGSSVDIAAIPLEPPVVESEIDTKSILSEDLEESGTGTFALTKDLFRPDPVGIWAGDQAMVLGYPVRTESPHWPIIRNGFISSPYGYGVNDSPCFLVDARMHTGTSGSPVLTLPSPSYGRIENRDGRVDRTPPYFIGIHSGDYKYETIDQSPNGPLDLHVTWYAETIETILNRSE